MAGRAGRKAGGGDPARHGLDCHHLRPVSLPLDDDGNVPADWQSAPITSKVKSGVRLQAPADLAASLIDRGQAEVERQTADFD